MQQRLAHQVPKPRTQHQARDGYRSVADPCRTKRVTALQSLAAHLDATTTSETTTPYVGYCARRPLHVHIRLNFKDLRLISVASLVENEPPKASDNVKEKLHCRRFPGALSKVGQRVVIGKRSHRSWRCRVSTSLLLFVVWRRPFSATAASPSYCIPASQSFSREHELRWVRSSFAGEMATY